MGGEQAKREVAALWPLISNELDEKSVCQIWEELHEAGQVTVCRSKFYLHVNRRLQPQASSSATSRNLVSGSVPPSPVIASSRPAMPSTTETVSFSAADDITRPFDHCNRPDEEQLWGKPDTGANSCKST